MRFALSVKVDEAEYRVSFRHGNTTRMRKRGGTIETEPARATFCRVAVQDEWVKGKDGETVGQGVAVLDSRDAFSREVGRRVSLQKALTTLDKRQRTAIWQEYLRHHPPKPRVRVVQTVVEVPPYERDAEGNRIGIDIPF